MTLHNLTHYSPIQLDQIQVLVLSGVMEAKRLEQYELALVGEGFSRVLDEAKAIVEHKARQAAIRNCSADDIIDQVVNTLRP